MGEVVTHQRFDRPKVKQPCPRRRKGTISFKNEKWNRWWDQMKAADLREPTIAEIRDLYKAERLKDRIDDLPLFNRVPPDELDRALKAGGLRRSLNVMYSVVEITRDEDGPPAA